MGLYSATGNGEGIVSDLLIYKNHTDFFDLAIFKATTIVTYPGCSHTYALVMITNT
jgi:hypothetical protein